MVNVNWPRSKGGLWARRGDRAGPQRPPRGATGRRRLGKSAILLAMSTDPTQPQGGLERRQSRQMSLKPGHPPAQVPGYEPERLLGVGAYGEVWVAREQNTGRRVAIKFYAHRSGLDWSLLSREVEKLAFLFADRYVVQLLAVGWDAEPPYYIMEYLPAGSLAERLRQGPLPVNEAVELFRDVAVGLVHAHGKGVLHCDLKPGNILLDEDNKPRMADFGQSRLSTEQVPALGTLFYMAPEQADLEAVPDARWDVYALGALLYCMLTGGPPHRTDEVVRQFEKTPHLVRRLAQYRRLIEQSPPPSGHEQVRCVDRALGEIIDRCLAVDPQERFPNAQAVLDALAHRAARRARRPMVVLGAALPALLLLVVTWSAWSGFSQALKWSGQELTGRASKGNHFAARYVARTAANELDRRYQAVERLAERLAASEGFRRALEKLMADAASRKQLRQIEHLQSQIARAAVKAKDNPAPRKERGDLQTEKEKLDRLCGAFREDETRRLVQREFEVLIPEEIGPTGEVASWFFCDPSGVSTVRVPEGSTIGKNFAWRSYFHGGRADWAEWRRPGSTELDRSWRPENPADGRPVRLSAIFPSQATGQWIVAVSTAVFGGSASEEQFLGVVALTVELGRFAELQGGKDQFAVLVDRRDGPNQGVILQHPLFNKLLQEDGRLPDRFKKYRLTNGDLPDPGHPGRQQHYRDPLADDPDGGPYDRRWLAQMEPIRVRGRDTGLVVVVQEAYDVAIGSTLEGLKAGLVHRGLIAMLLVVLIMISLWWFATRLSVNH